MSTKLKTIPLPAGLAPLPKGAVHLGEGSKELSIVCLWNEWEKTYYRVGEMDAWSLGYWAGNGPGHYAAPRDSAIAREILGVRGGPKEKPFRSDALDRSGERKPKKKSAKKAPVLRRLPKNVKPGTEVVCVETGESGDGREVLKERRYTANPSDHPAMVLIEGTGEWMWNSSRFRLAPAKKAAKKRVRVTGLPSDLPQDLPPVPKGYSYWEYMGQEGSRADCTAPTCSLLMKEPGKAEKGFRWVKRTDPISRQTTHWCIARVSEKRTRDIGVMPAPKSPDPIVEAGHIRDKINVEKFGPGFVELAHISGIAIPDWLHELPPVPAGFDRWEPSPKEVVLRDRERAFAYIAEHGAWCLSDGKTGESSFYIEAVRDEKVSTMETAYIVGDTCAKFLESVQYANREAIGAADPKGAVGATKPQLALIPPASSEEMAKALACGAAKYGAWNWREHKVEMMTYLHAMRRHIDALIDGEDIDPESGAHHLGHFMAGAGIILDARKHGTLIDNRPPTKP